MGHRVRQARGSGSIAQRILTAGLVTAFLVIAGGAGLFVFDRVYQFTLASDILPDFTLDDSGSANVGYEPGKPLPRWQGTDRVNILVMGIDQREHEQGPWRTDTMLVLTIDPVTMSAGMLSIPRDLWVPIWGYNTEGRINTAHYLGEVYGYPGGGPALAAETVQWNLGVHIHHYARVNFAAFEELVDLIGGVDICVAEEINDSTYPARDNYGYDPLHIEVGCQHFDGEMALKYARTRHTAGGDFDRAKRQQEILVAVFRKVTDLNLLPQLAPQAPAMWETLQDAVVTDLTLDEIVALARLASEVEPSNIRYGVIDESYTQFWVTPDGQQVLIPLRDRMRELRDYVFAAEPIPFQEGDSAALLASEAATIVVLNGTTTAGLAGRTSDYLQQHEIQVLLTENADRSDYSTTLIVVYTGKNYTADYLADLLGLPRTAIRPEDDPGVGYDIAIILGADYQQPEQ